MYRHRRLSRFLAGLLLVLGSTIWTARSAWAELSPEIQLGAQGIMSLNGEFTSDEDSTAINDFSDSGLAIGFRQKLYSDYRGQMVFGFQFPDADSDLGQLFFDQTFLKLDNRSNVLKMGRSRVRSTLIEFPTLRDDDALSFTDVLNPFSSGENSQDHQYGNVLELSRLFGQRVWLGVHGEHFTETPEPPQTAETDFSLNAVGLSLEYRVPETQRWNRGILDQAGISFNNFLTERPGYTSEIDQALKSLIASVTLNLRPDPVHFLDLRHQSIYNAGFDEVTTLTDYAALTGAKALATFTSLRYLYRRLEQPTAQLALSFGTKTFLDTVDSTNQWQLVANGFYRLGENFDIGLQFQHQQFSGDLEDLYGESESRLQFALTYSVEQSWNSQFDKRDSLLNLEHGYIP